MYIYVELRDVKPWNQEDWGEGAERQEGQDTSEKAQWDHEYFPLDRLKARMQKLKPLLTANIKRKRAAPSRLKRR